MRKYILTGFVALGLAATPALAQTEAPAFAALDVDASGVLSLEELQVAWPDLTPEAYAEADANTDGSLDETEFEAFVAASVSAI